MTKLIGALGMSAVLVLAPALVLAQDSEWQTEPAPPQAQAPQTPEPQEVPPPPPAEQPSAPQQPQANAQPEGQVTAAVPPGQWVYTQQYGWVWMPYADGYTSVPASGYGEPSVYVYYPAYSCWAWLAAPWVWGYGPWPYFGVAGPYGFAWFGWGWWGFPHAYPYAYPYAYPGRPIPPYRPGTHAVPVGGYAPHAGGVAPGAVAPRGCGGFTPSHAHR